MKNLGPVGCDYFMPYNVIVKIILVLLLVVAIVPVVYQHWGLRSIEEETTVVFVAGSYTPAWSLAPWRWYLSYLYPRTEVVVFGPYYTYRNQDQDRKDLAQARDDLTRLLQEIQGPLSIVTYSYGAVLLHVVLQNHPEIANRITKTVSFGGPLADRSGFTDQDFLSSQKFLGFDRTFRIPGHQTVCGQYDSLVPCHLADYDGTPNQTIRANHYLPMIPQLFGGRTIMRLLQSGNYE